MFHWLKVAILRTWTQHTFTVGVSHFSLFLKPRISICGRGLTLQIGIFSGIKCWIHSKIQQATTQVIHIGAFGSFIIERLCSYYVLNLICGSGICCWGWMVGRYIQKVICKSNDHFSWWPLSVMGCQREQYDVKIILMEMYVRSTGVFQEISFLSFFFSSCPAATSHLFSLHSCSSFPQVPPMTGGYAVMPWTFTTHCSAWLGLPAFPCQSWGWFWTWRRKKLSSTRPLSPSWESGPSWTQLPA